MDPFRLAEIAARAEVLRLRAMVRRHVNRALLAAIAAVFLLAALVAVHVAGAMLLAECVTPIQAALIVAGADLLLALIFALWAGRDRPSLAEREALALRRQVRQEFAVQTLVSALLRLLRR
jgi:hypothetical protein